jgi:hypothetical protein
MAMQLVVLQARGQHALALFIPWPGVSSCATTGDLMPTWHVFEQVVCDVLVQSKGLWNCVQVALHGVLLTFKDQVCFWPNLGLSKRTAFGQGHVAHSGYSRDSRDRILDRLVDKCCS